MSFIYKPTHQYQLGPGAGPTGGFDCTAYSAAMAIDRATIGGTEVTGRQVRLSSDEPYPDPHSPGLNIPQVSTVAGKWHVDLISRRGAPWSAVMAMLNEGRGVLIQGDYDQIPAAYSGQLSFKGDHAIFANHLNGDDTEIWWMDPLNHKGAFYIPVKVVRNYAEKLARTWGIAPGLSVAMTRITPNLALPQ